jgi:spore maturation protein CgeB
VTFFERDVPYYADTRDLTDLGPGCELVLYSDWADVAARARRVANESDVGIVTSFCPDAIAATRLLQHSRAAACFYDLDTPVTLARLDAEASVPYLGPDGLAGFDMVLSYTGGGAIEALRTRLGAGRVEPFYGWADPVAYRPTEPDPNYRAGLSYLGTYAQDRQDILELLFVAVARARPAERFVIGGAQYPQDFPWTENIFFVRHVPPAAHPAFYSAARVTLNVTRAAMARMGWCPSGRLFEAACCGSPILSDHWQGLDAFLEPGREILVADDTEQALAALDRSDADLAQIAARARERVLAEHTADHRARLMVHLFEGITAMTAG